MKGCVSSSSSPLTMKTAPPVSIHLKICIHLKISTYLIISSTIASKSPQIFEISAFTSTNQSTVIHYVDEDADVHGLYSKENDWVIVDKHRLSLDDKNIISGNEWLNDNIIFVSSILIKRLWPFVDLEIHGFRSSQIESKFAATLSPFIQVLHVKRSHWITVIVIMV